MKETFLIPSGATSVDIETLHEFNVPTPPLNQLPTVTATASSPTLPDTKIILNAVGKDNDGTVVSYKWTSIDGLKIDNENSASTFATATQAGTFRFSIQVTDNNGGASSSVTVLSTVGQVVNTPPIVNAGDNISITSPNSSVQLNGYGSDAEGDVSFKWVKVSGSGNLSADNIPNPIVSGLTQGVSVFRLTVTDTAGEKRSDDVQITVNAANVPGQTFPLSFTQLTTDYPRPFGGVEEWINQYQAAIPNVSKLDRYDRFGWGQLETTKGNYNFKPIGDKIIAAAQAGGKFSFGIMTYLPGAVNGYKEAIRYSDGTVGLYPQYTHNAMQASAFKDVRKESTWCPNWNSPDYLTGWAALNKALYSYLNTTKYNGILYKDLINYIDIRGYGRWSEWHMYEDTAPKATEASLMAIAKGVTESFPDIWLVALSDAFLPYANQDVTPNVSYYLLTGRNDKGEFGWRKDHLGSDNFNNESGKYEGINTVVNGKRLGDLVMNKWKVAPIVGEPSQSSTYNNMQADVTRYNVNSFGNGNYGNYILNNVVNGCKADGYRTGVTGGTISSNTGQLIVTLNWQNKRLTNTAQDAPPVYEDFDVLIELRQGMTVVRSLKSSFSPTLFYGSRQITDTFTGLPSGTYDVHLVVRNPNGYRNLPLSISGNKSGYLLKSGIVL